MPESTIIEFLTKTAATAGGTAGATGQSTGEAGKSTTEQGEDKKEKGQKKSMLGSVGKMLTGVLGIQVTFAAMLRQSQIATGFLGAVFQVLGAILDSFLLAFAPQLFAIVEHLAKLIPVARAIGEEVALQVGSLWEHLKTFTAWLIPIVMYIWEVLKGIFKWFSDLAPIWKWTLAAVYVLPRMLAFMTNGYFTKFAKMLFLQIGKVLTVHRAKSAATGGAAKGAGSLLMAIPHARIIMIGLALVAVVGTVIWSMFKSKDKGAGGATLDVTGQLGQTYQPSRASQLGGTLNEAYSAVIQPFTDGVVPELQTAAEVVNDAFGRTGDIIDEFGVNQTVIQGIMEDFGHGTLQSVEDVTRGGQIVITNFTDLAAETKLLFDITHLTQTSMDNARKVHDKTTEANASVDKEMREALAKANDNWVTDLETSLGIRLDKETLLSNSVDNRAKSDALAAANYQKKVTEAGGELLAGAVQSKNQFVDTTGLVYGSAQEMSESTATFLTQAFARNEKEQQMGALAGVKAFDTYLAMINADDTATKLADAAVEQKKAAVAFQVMSASVMTGHEADRARREQERAAEANNFAGSGDFGKFFDYLANY